MECPRCRVELDSRQASGPYRSQSTRCAHCGVSVVLGQDLQTDPGCRLGATVLTSSKARVTECCPVCKCALDRLTLSVHEAWVEIEECAACGMLVLDDGELERVRHLIAVIGNVANAQFGLVPGGTAAAHAHARAANEHASEVAAANAASEVHPLAIAFKLLSAFFSR